MNLSSFMGAGWAHGPQVLCDDEGILLCRACREGADGKRDVVLAVLPAAEHPTPQSLDRLTHEYGLKDELDSAWAAKPLELVQDRTRIILVLEDLGGEPLDRLLGAPMEMGQLPAPRQSNRGSPGQGPPARSRAQGPQASQYPGEPQQRRGAAHGLRHRLAPPRERQSPDAPRDASPERSPTWRPSRPGA